MLVTIAVAVSRAHSRGEEEKKDEELHATQNFLLLSVPPS